MGWKVKLNTKAKPQNKAKEKNKAKHNTEGSHIQGQAALGIVGMTLPPANY